MVSEFVVDVGFGNSFNVCDYCDKCRFIEYLFEVMKYVSLSFDFIG